MINDRSLIINEGNPSYIRLTVTGQLTLPFGLVLLRALQLVFLLSFVVVREVVTVCLKRVFRQYIANRIGLGRRG